MEFLNKLLKIKTSEDRILMGKLKSLDYKGNLYLSHAVEVYFKEEGFYSEFEALKPALISILYEVGNASIGK